MEEKGEKGKKEKERRKKGEKKARIKITAVLNKITL